MGWAGWRYLVVGAGWVLSVWGQVPQDKNGRSDR